MNSSKTNYSRYVIIYLFFFFINQVRLILKGGTTWDDLKLLETTPRIIEKFFLYFNDLPLLGKKNVGIKYDKLKIENPLKNLKVASYYGCMLLRPKEVGIDDPEAPQIMEKLVTAMGAESVEWDAKSRCCGSYHTVKNIDLVKKLVSGIINDARENGAEAIITSCPLCAFNLDVRQKEMAVKNSDFQTMPIFYFTQLLGIALGLEKSDLGLEFNAINPNEILKKYEKIKGAK